MIRVKFRHYLVALSQRAQKLFNSKNLLDRLLSRQHTGNWLDHEILARSWQQLSTKNENDPNCWALSTYFDASLAFQAAPN